MAVNACLARISTGAVLLLAACTSRAPVSSDGGSDASTVDGGGSSGGVEAGEETGTGDGSSADSGTMTDAAADVDAASEGGKPDASGGPPSCAPGGAGMTDCGPNGNESCCTSILVPGGTYYRTYSYGTDGGPLGEADPATVSSFRLDKYEVTVGRFRQWILASMAAEVDGSFHYILPAAGDGKHTHLNGGKGLANSAQPGTYENGWESAWSNQFYWTPASGSDSTYSWSPGPGDGKPMNRVTWRVAYAFCIWDGGFLPTEAEWEYVAAGGDQQREYAWGESDPGTASQYAIFNCNFNSPCSFSTTQNIAVVGSALLGAGRWGHQDMIGNIAEWVLDNAATYVDPCTDCAYLSSGQRILRGRDWEVPIAQASTRDLVDPSYAIEVVGWRCARSP